MTAGRFLSALVLAGSVGATLGLSWSTSGPPADRDTVSIGRVARLTTESIDPFGKVAPAPPLWLLDIRVQGLSRHGKLVVALGPGEAAVGRLSAGWVAGYAARRNGRLRRPKEPASSTRFDDTLGCRLAVVSPVVDRRSLDSGSGGVERVATLRLDPAVLGEATWIAVFDSTGAALRSAPLEVEP